MVPCPYDMMDTPQDILQGLVRYALLKTAFYLPLLFLQSYFSKYYFIMIIWIFKYTHVSPDEWGTLFLDIIMIFFSSAQ